MNKCLLWIPATALAWSTWGHEVIADVAWLQLTPEEQSWVFDILQVPMSEVSALPDEWRVEARHWHQDYRSDWHFGVFCGEKPCGDFLRGYQWTLSHFNDDRFLNLVWLIHLVADIHQPFHVGHWGDYGRNLCYVDVGGEKTNWHHFTDGVLFKKENAMSRASRFSSQLVDQKGPLDWAQESLALQKDFEIDPRSCVEVGESVRYRQPISKAEVKRYRRLLTDRLYTAGIRLAGVIKALYRLDHPGEEKDRLKARV